MRCKQDACNRRAHTSGWCSTHYWRRRNGHPMDTPIRRYVRHQGDVEGNCNPMSAKTVRRRRQKPFAAEWALLKELGLHGD